MSISLHREAKKQVSTSKDNAIQPDPKKGVPLSKSKRTYNQIQNPAEKQSEYELLNKKNREMNQQLLNLKRDTTTLKLKLNQDRVPINDDLTSEDFDLAKAIFGKSDKTKRSPVKNPDNNKESMDKILNEFKEEPDISLQRSNSVDSGKAFKVITSKRKKGHSRYAFNPKQKNDPNIEKIESYKMKNQVFYKPYQSEISKIDMTKLKKTKYGEMEHQYLVKAEEAKSKKEEYEIKLSKLLKAELEPILKDTEKIKSDIIIDKRVNYKYTEFNFHSKRDTGSLLYKIQMLYDDQYLIDLLNNDFNQSQIIFEKALIQCISSKQRNIENIISDYENQKYVPKNDDPEDNISKEELDDIAFIKKSDLSKISEKERNKSDSEDKESKISENNDQKNLTRDMENIDIDDEEFIYPFNDEKIFKIINRASTKNAVVDLDIDIEKNPNESKFPCFKIRFNDYLRHIYEVRHRYYVYWNRIKDNRFPIDQKIDLSKSFLNEETVDLYTRSLTTHCIKFIDDVDPDEVKKWFKDNMPEVKNLKLALLFFNSTEKNDFTVIIYMKFFSGKKISKDLFKGYQICRIPYIYLSDIEIFEIFSHPIIGLGLHEDEPDIQEKYEKRGNVIIEKKRRKNQ